MSSQSSITIKFHEPFKVIQVLDCLLKNGWSYNDYGLISYLPLHDTNFNWTNLEINQFDEFLIILNQKIQNNEFVGIALIHDSLKSGGLFHFDERKGEIMILLSIDRIKLGMSNFTDFSSYMIELLDCLPSEVLTLHFTDE